MASGWLRGILLAASVALTAAAGAALALDPDELDTAIAAVPGSYQNGYAAETAVKFPNGTVVFHNLDILHHNVVALDLYGSDEQPWCEPYLEGECPLFWTPLIGHQQETIVLGLDGLAPGEYEFYCTIHPWMQGTLDVRPETIP